ncbi:lipolytic protein G-D-S-L family [Inquilinus sp. KBS0705]|nr:lipolytic protein G-D-S-L family [Inquilinus sp. KBS0705]
MKNYSRRLTAIFLLISICILGAFRLPALKKLNIVFIGDSITQGQDNPALQPSVYAVNYLKEHNVADTVQQANRGINGKTTLDYLPGEELFTRVIGSADEFYTDTTAQLLFSVMLGTNDSAIKGTHGAPVSVTDYDKNITQIVDSLLKRYPNSKIVINRPIWYSPNTYNGAMYLAEGLARLQSYFPVIDDMVKRYGLNHPGHVFKGDTRAFKYFRKNFDKTLQHEQGRQGIFYLHPNSEGAARLGEFWARAINKALGN